MICSKKYVDETLKKHNLVANKSLGQNFLVDSTIAFDIIQSADIDEDTYVIEVGPGLGALTEILVEKAKMVLAYEIDENMVNILNQTFADNKNIKITNIDFLKVDIKALIDEISTKCSRIVFISNLPYYITSKLLNKILVNDLKIDKIVTMMQKEVGQKIVKPTAKEYNLLSVIIDYQYEASIIKYVGKNAYLPRPAIDSIVLKFKKIQPRFSVELSKLINVTNALFSARRKTVANNLKLVIDDTEKIKECLDSLQINSATHVEQLSFEEIIKICDFVE